MDLALRNATIVDGTGRPRFAGDIGVTGGRITAVGNVDGRAAEEIDCGGAVVSPGFIDCHTHYDAQISWDAMLTPSVYHGVTTVLAGNCGLTLAPLAGREGDVAYLLDMLANVEGLPAASLHAAVKPTWRTFAEFLDRFDGQIAANAAFMVGHSALRRYVMGERAVGHAASEEEIAAMAALLRRSLAEGGTGFSTSTSVSHSDHNGDPVPSRWATREELIALASVVRDFPGTWLEMVPGVGTFTEEDCQLLTDLSLAAERPLNWNAIFVDAGREDILAQQLAVGRYGAARGARLFGLTPATPLKAILNFRNVFNFAMLDGWKDFVRMSVPERLAAMREPEVRARLKAGAANPANPSRLLKNVGGYRIEDVRSERNAEWRGRLVQEYADAIGLDAFDALFALAVEEELWMTFSGPVMGADEASWALRERVWHDEHTLLGGSDAGAHIDMFNTFALTTQLLGEGVRERGIYSLEEGVRQMTSVLADAFGLKGRGRIEAGAAADLVVFDPATVGCGQIAMRDDLPLGALRLYADAIGVHHVIVNGVPVAADNRATGRLGGRTLRSGRDTVTVPMH